MKGAQRQTVGQQAVRAVGLRKGFNVLSFCIEWWMVEDSIGHVPEVEEFGEWWVISRSQAFRRQALFRQAFPDLATPSDLRALLDEVPAMKGRTVDVAAADLLSVALP